MAVSLTTPVRCLLGFCPIYTPSHKAASASAACTEDRTSHQIFSSSHWGKHSGLPLWLVLVFKRQVGWEILFHAWKWYMCHAWTLEQMGMITDTLTHIADTESWLPASFLQQNVTVWYCVCVLFPPMNSRGVEQHKGGNCSCLNTTNRRLLHSNRQRKTSQTKMTNNPSSSPGLASTMKWTSSISLQRRHSFCLSTTDTNKLF